MHGTEVAVGGKTQQIIAPRPSLTDDRIVAVC
jgi:hypothetical protein